jgi:hypothetical protein
VSACGSERRREDEEEGEGLQLVVLKAHGGAVLLDPHPHRALFLVAQKHPVGDLGGGAAAAFAHLVEERGADADAGAVG